MTAYVIVFRDEGVREPAEMAEYVSKVKAMSSRPKMLVAPGACEAIEGPLPEGVVVLEFDSVEAAKSWYYSPEYQAALPHRLKAANYRLFIVEGLAAAA